MFPLTVEVFFFFKKQFPRVKWKNVKLEIYLGGGNSNIFLFSPLFGEDEPILTYIIQMG